MKKEKKHTGKDYIRFFLILICLSVFLFALYNVIDILQNYNEIDEVYDETVKQSIKEPPKEEEKRIPPEIDFQHLIEINDDIVGWIFIEDTKINYPILKGQSNNQYLFQSYYKKYLTAGSIFVDYRCSGDFEDLHTVVYGHNMRNGAMFGKLDKFEDKGYRDKHPYVYVIKTDGSWNKYKIFSCYKADVEGQTYNLPMNDKTQYKELRQLIKEKNIYDSAYTAKKTDKILTLSTCTEDSRDDVRFVVNCFLVEQGQ